MANYLFIASTLRPFDGPPLSGPDVYELMMKHECWEVTPSSPHFKKMKPGDTLDGIGGQAAHDDRLEQFSES